MRAFAAGWLALFAVYLVGMPGTFYFEDGPELLACAATLGNTHEPGYPFLMLLGRLALAVPVGGPAFRMNLLNAAAAAGAAVALGALAAALARALGAGRAAPWAGVFAAGVWGLSDTFWWEAEIGDKYGLFYLLLAAALLAAWTAACAEPSVRPRRLAGLGLLGGLGFAHHPYAVVVLPAAGWAAGSLRGRGGRAAGRALLIAVLASAMPASLKVLYPPVRAGLADMDWTSPSRAERLVPYLLGRRYHRPLAETSPLLGGNPGGSRLAAVGRGLLDDLPAPLLAPALAGGAAITVAVPGFGAALGGVALLDALAAANASARVVRWWEPAFAVLLLLAGAGLAAGAVWLSPRDPRRGVALAAALAAAAVGWQAARGADRNALARFTAAHDAARNLLRSLPANALYLGHHDIDLFPLWAIRWAEGERPDVLTVGLPSIVDVSPADQSGLRALRARTGLAVPGWEALRALVRTDGRFPVWIAKTGYDTPLWGPLELWRQDARGLVAALSAWDPAASVAHTRRVWRAYTLRNLAYAPCGAFADLDRLRDEVARDGLLFYPEALSSLGTQVLFLDPRGSPADAGWAYRTCRRLLEPMTGPLPPGAVPAGWPRGFADALAERAGAAAGYQRLADRLAERDIPGEAVQFQAAADALRTRP